MCRYTCGLGLACTAALDLLKFAPRGFRHRLACGSSLTSGGAVLSVGRSPLAFAARQHLLIKAPAARRRPCLATCTEVVQKDVKNTWLVHACASGWG